MPFFYSEYMLVALFELNLDSNQKDLNEGRRCSGRKVHHMKMPGEISQHWQCADPSQDGEAGSMGG